MINHTLQDNMHDDDSNTIQYEVNLPVTVVKPEDWQTEILAAFKGVPVFQHLLESYDFLNYHPRSPRPVGSLPDVERRFYNVWALAGKPKVKNAHDLSQFVFDIASGFGAGLGTKERPRAYIDMLALPYGISLGKDTMYITNSTDAIAEMAHPIQWKFGQNNGFINMFDSFRFKDNADPQNGRYGNSKAFEYETHYIIEPQLRSYIYNNIIPDFLKQGNYDSK